MSAIDDLDHAIEHEHDELAECHSDHGCQERHRALIDTYLDARTALTSDTATDAQRRDAEAIAYTAKSSLREQP